MIEKRQAGAEEEGRPLGLGTFIDSVGFGYLDREFEAAADRALLDRPVFSIRARLILSFSFLFLLPLFITLWAMHILADVQDKILFLEAADDYKVAIQQARRFEKNFLLYGTNLNEAREHAEAARGLTIEYYDRFRRVVGEQSLELMNSHLSDYLKLLNAMGRGQREKYESELRDHGAKMVKLAQEFVIKERNQVHTMLTLTRRIPLIFLIVLAVLMVLMVVFHIRGIVGTLTRFMSYTQRISTGDFTPITPVRKFRDEFSVLAVMFNRMVRELARHHQILMESHKLRAMGTLVAGVAHELNNPMNNIMLTASLLQDEFESLEKDEKLEMMRDIIQQSERSKRIVSNLLDFARESETHVQALDLRALLKETIDLLANQLKVKKLRLNMEMHENLPSVHGDLQLLSQVFMNLLLNAVDVLDEKGEIQIRTDPDRREGYLAVDIRDNGPGIPGHILSRIFDPFFTTKPKGMGTGLGLSVSRGIVRRLGGYLSVQSQPGKGTTFTVLLPVTTIPSDLSANSLRHSPVAEDSTTGSGE